MNSNRALYPPGNSGITSATSSMSSSAEDASGIACPSPTSATDTVTLEDSEGTGCSLPGSASSAGLVSEVHDTFPATSRAKAGRANSTYFRCAAPLVCFLFIMIIRS